MEVADYLIIAANSDIREIEIHFRAIVDLNENGVNKTSLETIDPTDLHAVLILKM